MAHRRIQTISTPEGELPIVLPVAEQLLANGVISGELDGRLHAKDAATVKAGVMSVSVCDFCGLPGAANTFDVADFDYPEEIGDIRSTSAWAACDACAALIRADRRKDLLTRTIELTAFPKFTRATIAELQARFWKAFDERRQAIVVGQMVGDFVENRLPAEYQSKITQRHKRIEALARVSGLTPEELEVVVRGNANAEILVKVRAWSKSFGKIDPRTATDLLTKPVTHPLPYQVPHWQQALDMKFTTYQSLMKIIGDPNGRSAFFPKGTQLDDGDEIKTLIDRAQKQFAVQELGFTDDAKLLRLAQAYSFSSETTAAIREAAMSLPHDAPLSSVEAPPVGSGWYWFAEPLDLKESPWDKVNALLWGWANRQLPAKYKLTFDIEDLRQRIPAEDFVVIRTYYEKYAGTDTVSREDMQAITKILEHNGLTRDYIMQYAETIEVEDDPCIAFSAYVVDEKGVIAGSKTKGIPLPSTRWHWPINMSIHEMLAYVSLGWDSEYMTPTGLREVGTTIDKSKTLRVVAELSAFFLMSCLWFKQTVPSAGQKKKKESILTDEPGHIERHARKRYAREHKLTEPPTVRVVALRKTARAEPNDAPEERQATAREFHCRWIVAGHARLQPCGPGMKNRKLIWIDAYPKGPADKPLRVRDKVFAVVR